MPDALPEPSPDAPPGTRSATARRYRLLCGVDDGEIGVIEVPHAVLRQRLSAWPPPPPAAVLHPDGRTLPADAPLLWQPADAPAPARTLERFLRLAAPVGRTVVDIGGDAGGFGVALASGYARVQWVATTAAALDARRRSAALNGVDGAVSLVTAPGAVQPPAADIDLLTIDAAPLLPWLHALAPAIERDRPLLLLQGAADGSEDEALRGWLAARGYSLEAIFPREPRARWCRPPERQAQVGWFV